MHDFAIEQCVCVCMTKAERLIVAIKEILQRALIIDRLTDIECSIKIVFLEATMYVKWQSTKNVTLQLN